MNRVMMSQSGVGRLESMTGWPPIFAWVNSSRVNRSRQSHLRRPVSRRYTETSPCHLLRIYKCRCSLYHLSRDGCAQGVNHHCGVTRGSVYESGARTFVRFSVRLVGQRPS